MSTESTVVFEPGDRVKYCGDEGTVVSNSGDGGVVRFDDGMTCKWWWVFAGTPVTLVRKANPLADPLKPSPSLLLKVGSIIVHAQELASPGGHPFDGVALEGLLHDPEVVEWLLAMDKAAYLPKMRG